MDEPSVPSSPRRVPLWLKVGFTLFVGVQVWFYWKNYGPSNFLFFCDLAASSRWRRCGRRVPYSPRCLRRRFALAGGTGVTDFLANALAIPSPA